MSVTCPDCHVTFPWYHQAQSKVPVRCVKCGAQFVVVHAFSGDGDAATANLLKPHAPSSEGALVIP